MQIEEEIIKRRGRTIPVKTPLSIKIKKSVIGLCFTLLAIIVLFSIVYLLNSSQSNQKGYVVKEEQLKQDSLKETSRELTTKINTAKTTKTLQNSSIIKNLVKPNQIIYITNQKK